MTFTFLNLEDGPVLDPSGLSTPAAAFPLRLAEGESTELHDDLADSLLALVGAGRRCVVEATPDSVSANGPSLLKLAEFGQFDLGLVPGQGGAGAWIDCVEDLSCRALGDEDMRAHVLPVSPLLESIIVEVISGNRSLPGDSWIRDRLLGPGDLDKECLWSARERVLRRIEREFGGLDRFRRNILGIYAASLEHGARVVRRRALSRSSATASGGSRAEGSASEGSGAGSR